MENSFGGTFIPTGTGWISISLGSFILLHFFSFGATSTGGGELGDPRGDLRLGSFGGVAQPREISLSAGGGPVGVHGFFLLLRTGLRRSRGVDGGEKRIGEGIQDGARRSFCGLRGVGVRTRILLRTFWAFFHS